jgi:hypothetical protein
MKAILLLLAQGVQVNRNELGVPQGSLGSGNIANGLKLAFGLAGGIALVIVTIGGFKYVLSQGNPQETAKAKNTILYALIGLVVCLAAFSIVQFVIINI